jgi:beta-ribofuranosylaminobenzene 5'-phosphate synthase
VGSFHANATDAVSVTVPARLHLGFLDLNGGLGRRFGSVGIAISEFKTRIRFHRAPRTSVHGPDAERVRRHVETMQHVLGAPDGCDVRVDCVVPSHTGLGSGTQIALAVAAGLRRLHAIPLDIRGDALRLGRGARSGVGIGLFDHGGLVVDGGRKRTGGVAPVISRLEFPDRWRILVVLDPARHGLNGDRESSAFAALPPAPEAQAAHLCRLVVMRALPSLADGDLPGFASAIQEIQEHVGDHFAPAQGGRFSSPDVARALDALARAGALGIGQSSWGPTGFAFAPSVEEADRLAATVGRSPVGRGLDIRVCMGLNVGADITAHVTADAPDR